MHWITPIERATPYLTLRECATYASAGRDFPAAARRAIAAKGREWDVAGKGEDEVEQLAKVRALWSELPLFILHAPASVQYENGRLRGRESALLALRALPLRNLVWILAHKSYHEVAEKMQHAQQSIFAGIHGGDVKESNLNSVLALACHAHNCDALSFLLQCHAQRSPQTPLHPARFVCYPVGESVQLTQLLFDRGLLTPYSRDEDKKTLLHYAASQRSLKVIDFLLARGAKLDTVDAYGKTPLSYALCYNYLPVESAVVAALLEGGANPNQVYRVYDRGEFPLLAVSSYRVAELLLLHGAEVQQRDRDGCTALHHLVRKPVLVALLLNWGADPNSVDEKGMTPLHCASSFPASPYCLDALKETIELLVDAGARLHQKRHDKQSAFDLASNPTILTLLHTLASRPARQQELLVTQEVESEPVEEESGSSSPLALQITDLIQLLLSYLWVAEWPSLGCVSKATSSATAQRMAQRAREWGVAMAQGTQEQQRDALRALWSELPIICLFAPPDVQREAHLLGREALLRRLRGFSFAEAARFFLRHSYLSDCSPYVEHVEASLFAVPHSQEVEKRPLVDWEVRELLGQAGQMHHLKLVHFLMTHGALKNRPLIAAPNSLSIAEDLPISTLLLDQGILERNSEMITSGSLLRSSIDIGHVALTSLLLQRGVDPNQLDTYTGEPLLSLALHRAPNSLLPLLEAGADPNLAGGNGFTPLFHTSNPLNIDLLLRFGARVDQRDSSGAPPLHTHVASGNFAAIALLLQRGADPYATTAKGDLPIDEATEPELRELVLTAGAIFHPEREKESL